MVFGGGTFGRWLGFDEVLRVGSQEGNTEPLWPLHTKARSSEHQHDGGRPWAERRPQNETHPAGTFILDCSASGTVRHTWRLLFKPRPLSVVFSYGSLSRPRRQLYIKLNTMHVTTIWRSWTTGSAGEYPPPRGGDTPVTWRTATHLLELLSQPSVGDDTQTQDGRPAEQMPASGGR